MASQARVLEVGAGAGRFTVELARLGARVVVVDISPEQLRLNEEHVRAADLDAYIESRHVRPTCSTLSSFEDDTFDVVVCYGGPLSWVLDGTPGRWTASFASSGREGTCSSA